MPGPTTHTRYTRVSCGTSRVGHQEARYIRAKDNHTGNNSTQYTFPSVSGLAKRAFFVDCGSALEEKKLVLMQARRSLLLLDLSVDHGLGADELLHVGLGVFLRYY